MDAGRLPLVTGAGGFAGGHLIDHLLEHEPAVAAWHNPHSSVPAGWGSRVRWRGVDVLDASTVAHAIADLRPAAIYHCAGYADVASSWRDPALPLQVNALGTHILLEAVRGAGLDCRVLVIGSATVYKPSTAALTEASPLGPSNPYGVSKLAQEMVALEANGGQVLVARPFNHAGPRQSPSYVLSSFAQQIADAEAGRRPPVMQVGNLDARRDLTDVRDVARAYRLMVAGAAPGVPYNVCSGEAFRIGDLLEQLLSMSSTVIRIESDSARQRPADTPVVLGDHAALTSAVGWTPSIPIRQTLEDLLTFWRGQAGRTS